ncbi:hypothetical protein F4813DRAFT_359598 [Daldinia decipiens]|uniref:uncharacterized protein n=1 Tax=Daldinia decipiens TaxID=326647 RepID=UPI0020C1F61D|nr:uncharacterized protein F4813DRAFT_359598 [Daldinia decipiens]KAI1657789.1 hypothetical protein F4813DRAFT_359598 [Daldinia decipiens]
MAFIHTIRPPNKSEGKPITAYFKGSLLLTGANGAVGRSIISQFVSKPEYAESYHCIYTVRDISSAQALRSFLRGTIHSYEVLLLDLARLDDVRGFAEQLSTRISKQQVPRLRALVLNAAFLELQDQTWTEDGFDTSFASSYLGHWLLTLMLLRSMDYHMGRVVVVGSSVHDTQSLHNVVGGQYRGQKWKTIFHDSTDPLARGTWSSRRDDPSFRSGYRRYGAAKLCQVMMIPELQRRLDTDPILQNISVLGIDPGATPSGITRRGGWVVHIFIGKFIMFVLALIFSWFWPNAGVRTNSKSAIDILAATFECNETLGERPKGLYLDGNQLVEMGAEAKDRKKAGILWKDTLRYTALQSHETSLTNWE